MWSEVDPAGVEIGEGFKKDPPRKGRGPAKPPTSTKDLIIEDIRHNLRLSKTVRNMIEQSIRWSAKAIDGIKDPAIKLDILNKLSTLSINLAKITESLSKIVANTDKLDSEGSQDVNSALKKLSMDMIGDNSDE